MTLAPCYLTLCLAGGALKKIMRNYRQKVTINIGKMRWNVKDQRDIITTLKEAEI